MALKGGDLVWCRAFRSRRLRFRGMATACFGGSVAAALEYCIVCGRARAFRREMVLSIPIPFGHVADFLAAASLLAVTAVTSS